MPSKGNREFKELIEKVYEQRFNNKNDIRKWIDKIKTIPSFFYNDSINKIKVEIKEDEVNNHSMDVSKFYDNLQNIKKNTPKELTIEIYGDEHIYNEILTKYIDIIHFVNKANIKYYTKKYFKEKLLVELQALEDILEYAIKHNLKIKIYDKDIKILNKNLEIGFELQLIDGHYYFTLKQPVQKFHYVIYTNHYMYIYYDNIIYRCDENFIENEYTILSVFLNSYKNNIHISKINLTNFFSLIYPNIKSKIEIEKTYEQLKEYIPQVLKTKLFLDFDNRNYLIADLKFCYSDLEFNPIAVIKENINVNRNLLEETIFLNKLISSGFLLDEKNKRFIINQDDAIYNFIEEDLEDYTKISEVYTTTNFDKKKAVKTEKTTMGVKVNNNLLEIDFTKLPIDKKEIRDVLQKYKLNKKYHRLKDGSFISLENNKDIEFLNELLEGIDLSYKNIDDTVYVPVNRTLYLDRLLKDNNSNVEVTTNEEYDKIINNTNLKTEINCIPKELENILRDYQKIGCKWLSILDRYKLGGILADDMGLGKTIQILSIFIYNKKVEKDINASLVVAPSSLTLNWKSEADKYANNLKILVISGNQEERKDKIKQIPRYDLVITSYDLLKRDIEEYEKLDYTFRYVVADEAQYIKNTNTQNSKSIKRIKAQTKYALTGTPIENSLSELWSIFDFIMPDYLFTYKKFKKNYEVPIVRDNNEEMLKRLKNIIEPFILRRTKKDVLKELPDKTTIVLNNEMLEEQERIYLSYLSQARNELQEEIEYKGFEQSRIKILALLTRLRQICCHPSLFISNYKDGSGKLNQCIELIKDGIQSGHKILLFSGYTSMFEIIEQNLRKEAINYLKLTGKTNVKDRFDLIEKFNNDDTIKVFLISLKAGGTGINLTSADMVIHYDPWWNLSVENQATDRTHRIGQTKKVHVYKLITKNSIEEKIYDLQQRKKELIDNMLSTDVKFINSLSKDDILGLFEE